MKSFRITLFVLLTFPVLTCHSQGLYRKALFLGNSYIFVNNLPLLVSGMAASAGDSLDFEMYAPGGYTLGWQPIAHAYDPVSLALIAGSDWDFVVLQEQSQIPSIPVLRDSCMFPGSIILHDAAKASDPCTQVLFFLTWGRRFGGTQCFTPDYCSTDFADFSQMQDSVTTSYKSVADSLGDPIAPAGEAWRFVIQNYGMVLHDGDNSHPNMNGSYLAACVFYSSMFGKPTAGVPFTAGLDPDTALILQQSADSVVFGFGSAWNPGAGFPVAAFEATLSSDTLYTNNLSANSDSYLWNFGDGNISAEFEPVHIYLQPGTYNITLTACNECDCETALQQVVLFPVATGDRSPSEARILYDPITGTVSITGIPADGILEIFDLSGRKIRTLNLVSGKCSVSGLSSGVYLVRILSGKYLFQGKIEFF